MKKRPLLWAFLLVTAAIFLYGQLGGFTSPQLPLEEGSRISIYGTVETIANTEESQKICLSKVLIPSESITYQRQVLVYSNHISNLKIGYRIKVEGEYQALKEASNPGQFDQKSYYEAQGIGFIIKDAGIYVLKETTDHFRQTLYEIREYFLWIYQEIAGEEAAALFSAMILGEKDLISDEQERNYQKGGISHILAISGLHISLVGRSMYQMLRKLRRSYGFCVLAAGSFMLCYGIMVGFGVSARRAIFMFLIYLGAEFLGEHYDMLSALSLAGILILLKEPGQLFQCGFQLSFLSVGAVGGIYPVLRDQIKWKGKIWDSVCMGISVTSLTLPCTLYWFFEFMPYSLILNLLVIPLVPYVFLSGAAGALVGSLRLIFGEALAGPGVLILKVFELLIAVTETLPGSTLVMGRPEGEEIVGYYVCLFFGLLLLQWKKRKAGLCFGIALLVLTVRIPYGGEITFLDVGQGDCIFIRTPEGRELLIDGGSTTVSEVGKYRILPFLKAKGVGELDAVFLTHMDEDHISGVREILSMDEIHIKKLYVPEVPLDETGEAVLTLAKRKGTMIGYLSRGDCFSEKDFQMTCLYPQSGGKGKDKNENSLVFLAKLYDRKILLTGDLEGGGEETLQELGGLTKVDFLKVAHHGSGNATMETFLNEVRPTYSVISCGKENRYGHPAAELLNRLEETQSRVYCTMESGAITVKIYEKNMKIKEFLENKGGNP